MLLVFAAMSLAFVGLYVVPLRIALACALVCLAVAMALFLSEIHGPADGFRLPWLHVLAAPPASVPADRIRTSLNRNSRAASVSAPFGGGGPRKARWWGSRCDHLADSSSRVHFDGEKARSCRIDAALSPPPPPFGWSPRPQKGRRRAQCGRDVPSPWDPARMTAAALSGGRVRARLDDLLLLALLLGFAGVLTAAMAIQLGLGEIPCPLCLLERAAMFGVSFGLMMQLRPGSSVRCVGLAMVFALFLLVVSARQVLLDICPRPGHDYVGSAVLGLHLPIWSVLIAFATLTALAVRTAVLGGEVRPDGPPSRPARLAGLVGLYVAALCLVNLVSVLLQCGLGACRTSGYALLS